MSNIFEHEDYNLCHLGNVFDVDPNGDKSGSGHVWQVVPGILYKHINMKVVPGRWKMEEGDFSVCENGERDRKHDKNDSILS